MRRYVLIVLTTLMLGMSSGCFSLNWDHNYRHVKKFFDELRLLHEDIDRVVFGLERKPTE